MGIITKMLKQTAVYWALKSNESGEVAYDNFGAPVVTDPVEIACRWEDVNEEYIDANGTRQLSMARVYVRSDVDIGGILMLGQLTDITNPTTPKANLGAWEIRRFEKLPNLRNTEVLRTVYL